MKKHWLRGMLLGTSLALLLAGGVALAQGLTLTVDQDCFECWPGPYDGAPPDEYMLEVSMDGWDPAAQLCINIWANGKSLMDGGAPSCSDPPDVAPPYDIVLLAIPCDTDNIGSATITGSDLHLQADGIEELYGEWKTQVWQPGTLNDDTVTWRFAQDCAALEFVPEPGTMALLGSGLAGLAGYATLRWRTRS